MELAHHREGRGPQLVLIHGIGHRWQGWRPVIDELREHRELIALDLPGFGASPMPPPGTPPGIHSITGLVADFLKEQGIERPHVAGNSLGGWVALELARAGLVRSATGLSPAGFHTRLEGLYQRYFLRLARAGSRLLTPRTERLLQKPWGRRLVLSALAGHPERMSAEHALADIRGLVASQWFDETLVAITREPFVPGGPLPVPVTIAWGERDRLLLPHQADRAARAVPGARVLKLRGCGHVPFTDDPAGVAQVLLNASSDPGAAGPRRELRPGASWAWAVAEPGRELGLGGN